MLRALMKNWLFNLDALEMTVFSKKQNDTVAINGNLVLDYI